MNFPSLRAASNHGFPLIRNSFGINEKLLLLNQPRILVADNDPTTAESLALLNDRGSYRIVAVTDGREAFRLLKHDSDFSLAIFNLTMPHLHGVDLVRYMKTEKRLIRIPVIIISGEGGQTSVADSFSAGAIAFLAKPFAVGQLHRTIALGLGTSRRNKMLQDT